MCGISGRKSLRTLVCFISAVGSIGIIFTIHNSGRSPNTGRRYIADRSRFRIYNQDAAKLQSSRNLAVNSNYETYDDKNESLMISNERHETEINRTAENVHVTKSLASIINRKLNLNTPVNDVRDTYDFVIGENDVPKMFSFKRAVRETDCSLIFKRDNKLIVKSVMNEYTNKVRLNAISNSEYMSMSSNCSRFIQTRGYFQTPFTEIERDFPLAYSIVAYKDVEQIERLVRSIYRPQNYYCIHLDAKTSESDRQTLAAIARCLPNVMMSSRSVDVQWGQMSVLEAELVCMEDLLRYAKWIYFINLTGQEFPLKTNLEIVKILAAMKGANLVDATWVRARQNYIQRWTRSGKMPPHRIRPTKGSVHIAVNRQFVDFAINDPRSRDFLDWLNNTDIPDETFFSSLNHNPQLGILGSFLGEPEEYPRKPTFTRYKNWELGHGVWARTCSGKFVHNICILGVGDLHRLVDDASLFANKFHLDFQHVTYDCMEELIYNRTRDQYVNREPIDVTFYGSLDQVRLRLTNDSKSPYRNSGLHGR